MRDDYLLYRLEKFTEKSHSKNKGKILKEVISQTGRLWRFAVAKLMLANKRTENETANYYGKRKKN